MGRRGGHRRFVTLDNAKQICEQRKIHFGKKITRTKTQPHPIERAKSVGATFAGVYFLSGALAAYNESILYIPSGGVQGWLRSNCDNLCTKSVKSRARPPADTLLPIVSR